jgi:hypothetical protein
VRGDESSGLAQAVYCFCQRVVRTVTPAAYLGLHTCLGQLFGVPDGHILRSPVAVMRKGFGAFGFADWIQLENPNNARQVAKTMKILETASKQRGRPLVAIG